MNPGPCLQEGQGPTSRGVRRAREKGNLPIVFLLPFRRTCSKPGGQAHLAEIGLDTDAQEVLAAKRYKRKHEDGKLYDFDSYTALKIKYCTMQHRLFCAYVIRRVKAPL